jgi:hypothetical protein
LCAVMTSSFGCIGSTSTTTCATTTSSSDRIGSTLTTHLY